MNNIVNALRRHAEATPDRIVIDDGNEQLTFSQLLEAAEQLASRLRGISPRVMGLLADNGIGWVLADLAAMIASVPLVPLPPFASRTQLEHAIRRAGIDYIVTDQQDRVCEMLPVGAHVALASFTRRLLGIHCPAPRSTIELPADCCKVTFTSGTTADPKGVCLSLAMLERTADALREVSAGSERDRHLCVMPLATLLENVGGVYAPLLAGATILVPPLSTIGLTGSSSLDVRRLVGALRESHATSAILVPQMLVALVGAVQAGIPAPSYLRFLAVGGAVIPAGVLK
ncbi:MAG TPA: AMP-binding protein, partial [Paraburkholderia sp.]